MGNSGASDTDEDGMGNLEEISGAEGGRRTLERFMLLGGWLAEDYILQGCLITAFGRR